MENSSKFFCNTACEYFPCHKTDKPEDFNCLFCYCPLYSMGTDCGGRCTFLPGGIKDCSGCLLPHSPNAWEHIIKKLTK